MTYGWIKLPREFIHWEWYTDVNITKVFIHLLLTANHAPSKWRGILILPGQKITSIKILSDEVGLSVAKVRYALERLESTNWITIESSNKFSTITILVWDSFVNGELYNMSPEDIQTANTLVNNEQTNNTQITTNNNKNNTHNNYNDYIENNNNICSFFEELWKIYPRKNGKCEITPSSLEEIEKIGKEKMIKAIEVYKSEIEDIDPKYILYGSTFFNGRYKDYLDREPPTDHIKTHIRPVPTLDD